MDVDNHLGLCGAIFLHEHIAGVEEGETGDKTSDRYEGALPSLLVKPAKAIGGGCWDPVLPLKAVDQKFTSSTVQTGIGWVTET